MITFRDALNMTYDRYVKHLLQKYGPVPYNYFLDENLTQKAGKKISKTNQGLEIHHIDEYKYLLLSDAEACKKQNAPYDCQKADRLVYADKIEHLLLHIKIIEEYRNKNEWLDAYLCGPAFIIASTNDLYTYWFKNNAIQKTWHGNMTKKIIPKIRAYAMLLMYIAGNLPEENQDIVMQKILFASYNEIFSTTMFNKISEYIGLSEYNSTDIDL